MKEKELRVRWELQRYLTPLTWVNGGSDCDGNGVGQGKQRNGQGYAERVCLFRIFHLSGHAAQGVPTSVSPQQHGNEQRHINIGIDLKSCRGILH